MNSTILHSRLTDRRNAIANGAGMLPPHMRELVIARHNRVLSILHARMSRAGYTYKTVRFTAHLADGSTVTGPIQGNGGYIGNAALHASLAEAQAISLVRIRGIQSFHARKGRSCIYEPIPGHVAMYPDDCAESRGEPVLVPLVGTQFEVSP